MSVAIRPGRKIAYTIQNVGGVGLEQDVGDSVPMKYSLQGLKARGHDVNVFALRRRSVIRYWDVDDPSIQERAQQRFSGTRLFHGIESVLRRTQGAFRIPYFAAIDSLRFFDVMVQALPAYDLCHEHNGLFSIGTALACRKVGRPYLLTFSADPIQERDLVGDPLRGIHREVALREARFTYQAADHIFCVSNAARNYLQDVFRVPAQKISVMPNGVDLALFAGARDGFKIRAELGLENKKVIGFVGAFQPWHGLEGLITSFASVRRQVPQAHLLLVGDGRARPAVERAILENGVAGHVTITGLVPQVQVPDYLAAVDVAALPYPPLPAELWFSPLKLYEYMAAGKAIVASHDGQIGEVLQHGKTGLLYPPGDLSELTRSLVGLLEAEETRLALGVIAQQQAAKEHSWDQYVLRLEAIYERVMDTYENNQD
jgi:glycosyltransferase involved in cell wall biosynthesis